MGNKIKKNASKPTPGSRGWDISLSGKSLRYFYAWIVVISFLVYGNTIFNGYGLDDSLVTNHNPLIEKGIKALPEIFTTNYISEDGVYLDYRPLVKASFALEYIFFGWKPGISHFINILLFAFACCMLFKVLLEAFSAKYFQVLFLGVLIYVVHPVHTEVVASLKNRDEIFVLLFTFLSARFFLKYADFSNRKFFVVGCLMFLLALFSKISCLPFIASIPLLLYFRNQNVKSAVFVFGALAGLAAVYYLIVIYSLPGFVRPYDYVETPFPYLQNVPLKLGTAFYSLAWYLKLLAVPYPLSFYYGYNYVELTPLFSFWSLVSIFIHTAFFVLGIYLFRKHRLISFLLLFYLIQISLYSNLVLPLVGIVAERGLFFASLSFCVLLSWVINYSWKSVQEKPNAESKKAAMLYDIRLSSVKAIVILILLIGFGTITVARNREWKDTITLFEADMPHLKNSAKANYMMAKEIRRIYRTDPQLTKEKLEVESAKAVHYYKLAIEIYPQYAQAMEELGMVYAIEQRNTSMAVPMFKEAFAIDSTLWRSANNLALSFQISKDTTEAIYWYERSVKAHTDNPKGWVELSKLYYMEGKKEKALWANEQLLKITPESYLPYYNYAIYYMLEKDTVSAVKYFEEDIKRGEREQFPYFFLFRYYLQTGDTSSALRVKNLAPRISQ